MKEFYVKNYDNIISLCDVIWDNSKGTKNDFLQIAKLISEIIYVFECGYAIHNKNDSLYLCYLDDKCLQNIRKNKENSTIYSDFEDSYHTDTDENIILNKIKEEIDFFIKNNFKKEDAVKMLVEYMEERDSIIGFSYAKYKLENYIFDLIKDKIKNTGELFRIKFTILSFLENNYSDLLKEIYDEAIKIYNEKINEKINNITSLCVEWARRKNIKRITKNIMNACLLENGIYLKESQRGILWEKIKMWKQ